MRRAATETLAPGTIPAPFVHQLDTSLRLEKLSRALITSDPGTGKTRSVLDAYAWNRRAWGRMLVLAPLSLLKPAWLEDARKFQPGLRIGLSLAGKRHEAHTDFSDIVVTNHDAVKWLMKDGRSYLPGFDVLCVDEFTAFKNRNADRSKALRGMVKQFGFSRRIAMSGTPHGDALTDIWHPMFVLDAASASARRSRRSRRRFAAREGPVRLFRREVGAEAGGRRGHRDAAGRHQHPLRAGRLHGSAAAIRPLGRRGAAPVEPRRVRPARQTGRADAVAGGRHSEKRRGYGRQAPAAGLGSRLRRQGRDHTRGRQAAQTGP